jgi:ABC-2 type transport system permease protein
VRAALHAEWTKLRTVAAPRWLLLGAVAATVGVGAGAASLATCTSPACGGDPTRLSLLGVQPGQALVAVLAVLTVSGEYGTGMIRTTLTAIPRRSTALAAKAVTVAGTVAVLGSLLVGRLIMPALPLTGGPTPRATAGAILYLALVGLLSLGVAATLRDSATSIGTVLGLLYLFPLLAQVVGDPQWQRLLQRIGPTSSGLAATAGWAAASLLVGALLLRLRDA